MRYIVSDAHEGLKAARKACFSGVPWQRCQFHLMQNAMSYIPSEATLLKLASAVLMETDEAWMSGRKYLTMETN